MSSSTSGQCTPCPDPMRRRFARCFGVASDSRQDQASGTLMTRPSTRFAMISSSVTRTSWMRGSFLAAVFMPHLQNRGAPRADDSADHVQLVSAEAVVRANSIGSSQNLHVLLSRSTCTCVASLQSKLVKKNRYGPGMPLILGIQRRSLLHPLSSWSNDTREIQRARGRNNTPNARDNLRRRSRRQVHRVIRRHHDCGSTDDRVQTITRHRRSASPPSQERASSPCRRCRPRPTPS